LIKKNTITVSTKISEYESVSQTLNTYNISLVKLTEHTINKSIENNDNMPLVDLQNTIAVNSIDVLEPRNEIAFLHQKSAYWFVIAINTTVITYSIDIVNISTSFVLSFLLIVNFITSQSLVYPKHHLLSLHCQINDPYNHVDYR
jgi:hypothetical protein